MVVEDNIGKRIMGILKGKGLKPTPFEESQGISRGYLKRAADNNTGIGTEIVEKILLTFPDLDAYWLITGKHLSRNTDENITPATKSEVKQVLEGTIRILREENMKLLNIVELALKRGGTDGA